MEGDPVNKKRYIIYTLILLAVLLGIAAYQGFVYWPFGEQERPTLVYFYAGD